MTPRRGRRVAGGDTRTEILTAARTMFGDVGYTATTLRAVALQAGVDPALIVHHFGSKDALFRSAMRVPFNPESIVEIIKSGDPRGLGERVCAYFLGLWEEDATREPLLAVLRSALTHEVAADSLRDFVSEALVGRVATLLGVPDAPLRATLVGSQLVGLAIARYVLRIEPLASADATTIAAWIGPTVQRYLVS